MFDRVAQKSQPSSARWPKSYKLLNTFANLVMEPSETNGNEMYFATGISPKRFPRSAHEPPFTTEISPTRVLDKGFCDKVCVTRFFETAVSLFARAKRALLFVFSKKKGG